MSLFLFLASLLGSVLTAESTTYRQKNGFSIDGEVFSVGTGGIIFRTSQGRLTARVPLSELEESDIAADPKVTAYLERQAAAQQTAPAENTTDRRRVSLSRSGFSSTRPLCRSQRHRRVPARFYAVAAAPITRTRL